MIYPHTNHANNNRNIIKESNYGVGVYLVLIFGLMLRLISLNQSLWLDEATSALVAKMSISNIFTKFLPGDFHPPFYYLLLKFWTTLFGYSEISLRIPSIIFGLGTIYVTFLIAKKLFNKQVGIISSLLVAISGLSIYYSQEARMYSLAAFLVSLLVYMFIKKDWLLFSIFLILLAMTDYVSLLILPVFWLIGLKDWKKMAIAHIPMIAVFAIWFPIFRKQLLSGLSLKGSNWWNLLGPATFKNTALIPVKFILGRISFDNKFIYGIIVAIAFVLFGYLLFKAKRESKLIWLWLILPLILGIVLSFKIPTLSYFRFLFALPPLYILIAVGIEKLPKYKYLFLSAVLIVGLSSSLFYLLNPKFQREDWRAAIVTIGSDTIVMPFISQSEALEYYGRGSQIEYVENFAGRENEIWLSRYVWQVFDPSDSARKKIESLGYNKTAEKNFNGVAFYQYKKINENRDRY